MSTHADRIQNWLEFAQNANWSVGTLAKKSGVSVRMLERHFLQNMGKPPKAWLIERRQKRALELLHDGCSVKETAAHLGYQYSNNFSREFKAFWGYSPSAELDQKGRH
jgi:AraC-like DNA-binding protein